MMFKLIVNFLLTLTLVGCTSGAETGCQLLAVSGCSYNISDEVVQEITFPSHNSGT